MRAATARYLATHEALWRSSAGEHDAGVDYETPEFLRLNRAASDSAAGVPRWRQVMLNRRLVRKLRRTGFAWCLCDRSLTRAAGDSCPCREVMPP